MEIDIKCELPFSWCKFCSKRDLTREELIANGEVYESSTICQNAPICEACERARDEEAETTLVIEPDESQKPIPTEAVLRMQAKFEKYRQAGRKRGIEATKGSKQSRRQNNKGDSCLGSGHGETWMRCRLCGRSYEAQSELIEKETGERYCPWCEGYGKQEE